MDKGLTVHDPRAAYEAARTREVNLIERLQEVLTDWQAHGRSDELDRKVKWLERTLAQTGCRVDRLLAEYVRSGEYGRE